MSAVPQASVESPDWATTLRSHGRRVTKQRLSVLGAAHSAPHQDAEHIWSAARKELPGLTLQSVYTVLSDLTALGLLRKIDLNAGPARYETRVGDNHHHAVCEICNQIEDVECAVGHAPCLQPSGTTLSIYRADVTFRGICAVCLSTDPPVAAAEPTASAAHRPSPHSHPILSKTTATEGES